LDDIVGKNETWCWMKVKGGWGVFLRGVGMKGMKKEEGRGF
jgi:hypothetical protein